MAGTSYESEEEIRELVRRFENCSLPDDEFTHTAHLTVALAHLGLDRLTVDEAVVRMREGLFRFLDHHEKSRDKYNETITLFWMKLVRALLDRSDGENSIVKTANELVTTYASSQFVYTYYTRDLLFSDLAKKSWVEPDLKPLEK